MPSTSVELTVISLYDFTKDTFVRNDMALAIEFDSVEDVVKDSEEVMSYKEKQRIFDYDIKDKNIKSKLLKGAKRGPFEMVKNTGSVNLVFNLGSWNNVVLPSIGYWNLNKGDKTCKVAKSTIRIVSVKTGTEAGGKHIDTQIVFFIDREKAVCHF